MEHVAVRDCIEHDCVLHDRVERDCETKTDETHPVTLVVNHEPVGVYPAKSDDRVSDLLGAMVTVTDPVLTWADGRLIQHHESLTGVSVVVLSSPCESMTLPKVKKDIKRPEDACFSWHAVPMDTMSKNHHFKRGSADSYDEVEAIVFGGVVFGPLKGNFSALFQQSIANDVLSWRNMILHAWKAKPERVVAVHGPPATLASLTRYLEQAESRSVKKELDAFVLVLEGTIDLNNTTILLNKDQSVTPTWLNGMLSRIRAKNRFVFVHGVRAPKPEKAGDTESKGTEVEPSPEPDSESESESDSESESESESDSESEPESESESESDSEPSSESKPKPAPESKSEPSPAPKSDVDNIAAAIRGSDEKTIVIVGTDVHNLDSVRIMHPHVVNAQIHVQRKHPKTQGAVWCSGVISENNREESKVDITFSDGMIGRSVKYKQTVDFRNLNLFTSLFSLINLDGDPVKGSATATKIVPSRYRDLFAQHVRDKIVPAPDGRFCVPVSAIKACYDGPTWNLKWGISAEKDEMQLQVRNRPDVLTIWDTSHPYKMYTSTSYLDVRGSPSCEDRKYSNGAALIIGSYKIDYSNINSAMFAASVANDTKTIREAMTSPSVFNMDPDRVVRMTNPFNLTVGSVKARIRSVVKDSEKERLDTFVFFFAGHGIKTKTTCGEQSGVCVSDDIMFGADLMAELQDIHTKTLVVLIQSCFSGGFAMVEMNDYMTSVLKNGRRNFDNLCILTSCAPPKQTHVSFKFTQPRVKGETVWVGRSHVKYGAVFCRAIVTSVNPNDTVDVRFDFDGFCAKNVPLGQCAVFEDCRGYFTSFLAAALQGAHTCPLAIPNCPHCLLFRKSVKRNADPTRTRDPGGPPGIARVTDLWSYIEQHNHPLFGTESPYVRSVGRDTAICPIPIPVSERFAAVPRPPTYALDGFDAHCDSVTETKVIETQLSSRVVLCYPEIESIRACDVAEKLERGSTVLAKHFCLPDIDPETAEGTMIAQSLAYQMVQCVPTFDTFLNDAMGGDVKGFFEVRTGIECLRAVLFDALAAVKVPLLPMVIILCGVNNVSKKELAFLLKATRGKGFPHWIRVLLVCDVDGSEYVKSVASDVWPRLSV